MSTVNVTNIKHPSSSSNNIVLNSDGTCSFGGGEGKIVQVKAYMTDHTVNRTSTGYLWGSSNGTSPVGSRIQYTPVSTSNRLIFHSSLAFGKCNLNGGVKWNINGSSSGSFWMATTSNSYQGGSAAYTGAFNTADQGLSNDDDYGIGQDCVTLITPSSYTLPSSIDFGLYYYTNASSFVNLNRQNSDNGGRGVSSVVIYEVESA